jgi:ATP-binding cassette, subfamily B, bacterial
MNAPLVPGSVRACLEDYQLNHRPILVSIDTDFSLNGIRQQEWLVVTPDHINVLVTSKSQDVLVSIDWEHVEAIRTVAGVGSGLLQVQSEDRWIDILRFSNGLANRFHKVSRTLERILEGKRSGKDHEGIVAILAEEPLVDVDPPRCTKCSLRLSTKEESCPRCMEKGRILKQITSLLLPHRRGAFFLCALTILGVVAELVPPKLQQYMVDHILIGNIGSNGRGVWQPPSANEVSIHSALLVVVLALAFSRVLLSIVGAIKGQIATAIGTGLTSTLRQELVQKLQRLAVAYYDRHQVGSMLSRVAHDSEVLHGLMHQLTGGFLLQTAQLVGVGAMLLWLNPKLAMFTLIPVPLVIAGSWVFWRKVYPRYYRLWDASSRQMSVLGGMLSGIRVVKSFAQEALVA